MAQKTALELVMTNKDVAPLILNHLDLDALAALTRTCGFLKRTILKHYHYSKEQLINKGLVTYHLLSHPAYDNQFTEFNFHPLLIILKRNLRFAQSEFHKSAPSNNYRALYGEPKDIPFALAALMGRYEIIYYLVETNSHYPDKSDEAIRDVIKTLKSRTGHSVSFYMIYGRHLKLLKVLVQKNHLSRNELSDIAIRKDLLFAGGCAGISQIDSVLQEIYQVPVVLDLAEKAIVASGLITAGHLKELTDFLENQKLDITFVLHQHPTCLYHAARNAHRGLVNFVLEQIDLINTQKLSRNEAQFILSETDENQAILLHYFAYQGWESEFKRYSTPIPSAQPATRLRRDALPPTAITPKPSIHKIRLSPTHKDKYHDTPLLYALRGGRLSMAQFIEKITGENLKKICLDETTAIAIAETIISLHRNDLILPLISEYQLPIKLTFKYGMNILQLCAKHDNWEAFCILMNSFEDPLGLKLLAKEQEMPITHVAASYGRVDFLRKLKKHCLPSDDKNSKKQTFHVKTVDDQYYKKVFGQVDSHENNMLHKACENLFLARYINLLIDEFNLDLRQKNTDQNNPLHVALNRIDNESRDVIWSELALIIHASEYSEELWQSTNQNNQSIQALAIADNKESLFAKGKSPFIA